MLTSRLGDSMTFSFIGTGIYIIGTTGKKGGLIDFSLDGVNVMTNFSRQNPALICDQILFNKLDLTLQQHTVVATLAGQQINLGTGQLDGVLSVQRVSQLAIERYTIPAQMSSSIDIVPIICVILAVVGLNAASGLAYFLWRRRHPKPRRVVSSTARTGGDSLPEDRNDTRLAMFGFRLPRKRRGDRTLTQSQAEDDAAELGPLTRTSPVTNRSEKSSEP
ncbi:hypothetical protein FRB90_007476 [Tulasnella sp. 427]|nr:hypothetical protein FRB90_007476 [Tulasnella sp. 427]